MDFDSTDLPHRLPRQPVSDIRNEGREEQGMLAAARFEATRIIPPEAESESAGESSDLPLRSPSPRKLKRTFASNPTSTSPLTRRLSLNLPPPSKRQKVGSKPASPTKPTIIITSPVRDDEPLSPCASVKRPFQLLAEICAHQELMLKITTQYLPPRDTLTLFTVDKTFHYLVLSHYSKFILTSTRIWCPILPHTSTSSKDKQAVDITQLMPFGLYSQLCMRDATRRPVTPSSAPLGHGQQSSGLAVPTPLATAKSAPGNFAGNGRSARLGLAQSPTDQDPYTPITPRAPDGARLVPTFRYLFFLQHRVAIIWSILRSLLYDHEFRLPQLCAVTLLKIWMLMDIPMTGARIALIHNESFFTDDDLYRATLITIKLDMAFTDPVTGRGECAMRKLMLAQRSLSTLDKVLRREACRDELELTRLYLRWKWHPKLGKEEGSTILGVPIDECGVLEQEGWGKKWIKDGLGWRQVDERPTDTAHGRARSGAPQRRMATRPSTAGLSVHRSRPPAQHPHIRRGPQPAAPAPTQPHTSHNQTTLAATPATPHRPPSATLQLPNHLPSIQTAPYPRVQQTQPLQQVQQTQQAFPMLPKQVKKASLLVRPDELVLREGIRRRLGLERQYLKMMTSGYFDDETLEGLPAVVLPKGLGEQKKTSRRPRPEIERNGASLGSWKEMVEEVEKLRS